MAVVASRTDSKNSPNGSTERDLVELRAQDSVHEIMRHYCIAPCNRRAQFVTRCVTAIYRVASGLDSAADIGFGITCLLRHSGPLPTQQLAFVARIAKEVGPHIGLVLSSLAEIIRNSGGMLSDEKVRILENGCRALKDESPGAFMYCIAPTSQRLGCQLRLSQLKGLLKLCEWIYKSHDKGFAYNNLLNLRSAIALLPAAEISVGNITKSFGLLTDAYKSLYRDGVGYLGPFTLTGVFGKSMTVEQLTGFVKAARDAKTTAERSGTVWDPRGWISYYKGRVQ